MTDITKLVEYELPTKVGVYDYIHSYLVEHPLHYYLVAARTDLYYLDREFGLMHMCGDYTTLTHEEITEYILGVLEMIRSDRPDLHGHGNDGS